MLHTVDQGVAAHVIGNSISYIAVVCNVFGGSTYVERMKPCAADLMKWYSEHRREMSSKLRVRADSDWPWLRAKAAATRHLAAYALYFMQTFGNIDSLDAFTKQHDRLLLGTVQLLCNFYEILQTESMFLSAATKEVLPKLAIQLMGCYSQLSTLCFDAKIWRWKVSPKMHLFMHPCLYQAVVLRDWWTYGDEDLMGILVGVATGVHPNTLAVSVMTKWLHCAFDQLPVDPDIDPRDRID